MQFKILLKKNWIYWKRNKIGSIVEISIPILLCLILLIIKPQIPTNDFVQSTPKLIPTLTNPILPSEIGTISKLFAQIPPILSLCNQGGKRGYIALAPQFPITTNLQGLFTSLNLTTRFFNSNADIDAEILSSTYAIGNYSQTANQICFGIVFDSFTNNNFSYSLRYNVTGGTPQMYSTSSPPRINYRIEDTASFNSTLSSGSLHLQILIDSMIISQFSNIQLTAGFEKFIAPVYSYANFSGTLSNSVILIFILCSLVPFIRIISHIVSEREARVIENMENMGLSKAEYFLSIIIFTTCVHFLVSIITTILLRFGSLFNVNWFLIWLTYFLFILSNNAIAFFISCFFSKSKKGIIAGLLVFLFLFLFWILRSSLTSFGSGIIAFISITPTGALSNLIPSYLEFANYYRGFSFSELGVLINHFFGYTYLIVTILEWIGFTILSFYALYVVPLDIGLAKHPLFIFGFKEKAININEVDREELEKTNHNPGNFEEIEGELKVQEAQNRTLKIQNLFKIYSNKKIAVKNLSLDMYSDQIFALLGHNGAGKTTTISMISGMYDITKGAIKIMGLDSKIDHDQLKKIMGVCPQTNPVLDYMTVQEHMELYARIKGVSEDLEPEIERLLKGIDLFHKRNYLAGKLSGGQKRKLCVALAFVGNSKVIVLDEPTSGMDTYARRHLWEMLKQYKKDKLIILTTHNMDEADFLGDRIGIMSDGELITCGSPLFLKRKFGDGYELTVLKKLEFENQSMDDLKALIKSAIPQSSVISEIGCELKFRLPENSTGFRNLFGDIEANQELFGIQSFGVNLNTLEDVFIKITQIASGRYENQIEKQQSLNKSAFKLFAENDQEKARVLPSALDMDLRTLTGSSQSIFGRQLKALLKKRVLYTSRNVSSIVCEIICPIVIVIIGLGLTKINFFSNSPKLIIDPTIYAGYQNFTSNQLLSNGINQPLSILNLFNGSYFRFNETPPLDLNTFANTIFNQNRTDQLFAVHFDSFSFQSINYTLLYNTTAPFIPFVVVNQISNAILQLTNGVGAPKITLSFNPLKLTQGLGNLNATVHGFIIVVLLLIAFAFIPNSLIQFIIKERENNAKHQQIISGTSIGAYWLSNFIVDYIKYLIPGLFIYAMFFAFGVNFFTEGNKAIFSFLIIVIYGFGMIGMTYTLSFLFKSPGNGQVFAFLLFSFLSFVLVIVSFVLKVIPSTKDAGINIVPYIFNLVPPFSFGNSFMNLANDFLYKVIYGWTSVPGPFDQKIALNEMIYLICFSSFFCLMVFIIEYWQTLTARIRAVLHSQATRANFLAGIDLDQSADEDVLLEAESVKKQTKAFSVYVNDLYKTYKVPNPETFCGTLVKRAVNGITFGIEQGSVFCLLGTNGAGKTTTFKILTGDIAPSKGLAYIRGLKLPEELGTIRQFVGYCPQFDSLTAKLTTEEHLRLYSDLKGIEPKYQTELIDSMIESLNLQKFRHVQAGTYSGGNKRKLSIAIALIGHPPIVFLDEPSAGMDPEARRFMWDFISEISTRKSHSSIILTTHSMEEAQALASKVAIMVEGKIKTIGTVQRLKDKYGKGFEIEVKIKIPEDALIKENLRLYFSMTQFATQGLANANEITQLLKSLSLDWLNNEIVLKGKGSAIFQRLKESSSVELSLLAEWIEIQVRLKKIKEALSMRFQSKMIESYQTYAKFNIADHHKLSEIFGFMEEESNGLEIGNFAVREISLEQIFIQFAQNIVHDD